MIKASVHVEINKYTKKAVCDRSETLELLKGTNAGKISQKGGRLGFIIWHLAGAVVALLSVE